MFNLNCKTIPMSDMRYSTIGDYWTEGGCTQYRVASMGNKTYEFLVFIHEVIEKALIVRHGVTEQMVDAWDLTHEDDPEPGALEGCPYREAHLMAEGFERALAIELGVDWDHYSKSIEEIMKMPVVAPKEKPPYRHPGNRNAKLRAKVRERQVTKG